MLCIADKQSLSCALQCWRTLLCGLCEHAFFHMLCMLSFLSFLSHAACAEAVLCLIPVSLQQVYGAAECFAWQHCSQLCTADPPDHHKTAGPSSRQLRSFGVQLTSHVERRELARAHIHAFPTEKRQLRAKAGCIWAWLDGIARGRARARRQLESDPQTSTQEAPAIAELRPPAPAAAGSGRAMGAWGGAGGPGNLDPRTSERLRCHPYPQVWHWGFPVAWCKLLNHMETSSYLDTTDCVSPAPHKHDINYHWSVGLALAGHSKYKRTNLEHRHTSMQAGTVRHEAPPRHVSRQCHCMRP